MSGRAWIVLCALALLPVIAASAPAAPPMVTAVELSAVHRLPEAQVRAAMGDLTGRPLSRDAVRDALDRLWGLGLFSAIHVDEVPQPGDGVSLVWHFTERPLIRTITWQGPSGIDLAELAATAGLAIGEEASPARLARAERDLVARYHRDGYLAARVAVRDEPVPESSERDVTVVLNAGSQARIGRVQILGETGLPAQQIVQALNLSEGSRFKESLAQDGVRAAEEKLHQQGYFEARVSVNPPQWNPDTNRVDLDVTVAAGPLFRVEFEGRGALPESALRPHLTFASSGSTDTFEQEASAHEIAAAYRERGYAFVSVTPGESRDGDVRVIRFAIDEGPRVKVESIAFTGNTSVSSARLAEQVETRRPALFRRGLFRQDVLDHDVGVITAYLRSLGYAEAVVGPPQVNFSEDRTRATVVIPVTEGPRIVAGTVTIDGASVFTPSAIAAVLPFKAGSPWEAHKAEDGQRAIERLYGTRGYNAAVIRVETTRHDDVVDVRYDIDEGSRTRIGRILLRGLLLTREEVVRRILRFQSGDILIPDQLLDGQRRLGELAAFDSVSVDPLRPPPDPFADVEVTLRERKPWHLDFGLGYSNADGGRGFVELGHDNVFGTGASASIRQRLSAGGDSTRWAERTDMLGRLPFVLGTPWWVDVDLFQEQSGQLGYDFGRAGLWVDAHRELFPEQIRGLRGDLRYRFESVRYSNVDPALAQSDVTPGRQLVVSVTPVLTLDRRDEPLDPTRGSLHQVYAETGTSALGSQVQFVKGWLESRWFFKWPPPIVIAVAGRLGLATPFGDTTALTIQDRFFAGGATTVRGFRQDRLGPLDANNNPTGGNATAILNLEWRFPIWRWFGGAVFVDSGTVTPLVSDLNLGAFKTGAGGGLRIRTPVGPIRFDMGYALQPIPGESRTQFYVTVGNPF